MFYKRGLDKNVHDTNTGFAWLNSLKETKTVKRNGGYGDSYDDEDDDYDRNRNRKD